MPRCPDDRCPAANFPAPLSSSPVYEAMAGRESAEGFRRVSARRTIPSGRGQEGKKRKTMKGKKKQKRKRKKMIGTQESKSVS